MWQWLGARLARSYLASLPRARLLIFFRTLRLLPISVFTVKPFSRHTVYPLGVITQETTMYGKRLLAATAIGIALFSTSAMAQTAGSASAKGEWQASKLIGINVYNDQNQKIGDIKELLLDKNGKVQDVAIAVGGFLGMGEHDVAVQFNQLKWSDAPVARTTSSNAPNTMTTGSNTTTAKTNRNYPDHAVLNATKDQLKSMPQFDYSK
jgi:sporulation protein YlmC with PRC-barrel domain